MEKRYKQFFKENSLSVLKDEKIIDDIFEFIYNNPYPVDADFHKFVESKGAEPDDYETYVYAILSCFIVGGKSYKSKIKYEDISEQEKKDGLKVEMEHVDEKNDNKVVKKICDMIAKKIHYDHDVENENYYKDGKKFNFFDELK
jgi:hypothetical protein